MRLRTVFLIMVLFVFTIGLSWSIFYLVDAGRGTFNNQIEDYLVSVIDSNEERIGDVFHEIEGDVLFLAESEKVKDILKRRVGASEAATKYDVDGKVSIVAREVENYIKSHPDMTLKELRENNEFRAIAVQRVGETGYAGILDVNTTSHLHVDPSVEGSSLDEVEWDTTEFRSIFDEAVEIGVSGGFYTWIDLDRNEREKYAEVRRIGTPTADEVILYSVTTAYVDDYLVSQNVSESLDNYFAEFVTARDYHNVLFVSKDNRVVYISGTEDGLGSNLENIVSGFGEIYSFIDNLEEGDLGFYGPFVGHAGDTYLQFAAASRVYSPRDDSGEPDGDEFLGTIVVIDEMDSVNNILEEAEDVQSEEFDEDYLVNGHGLLITPLRARNVDMMVQEIKTESVEECLEDFVEAMVMGMGVEEHHLMGHGEGHEEVFLSFLNFNGDLTLGLHKPIGKMGWCVLSEVGAENILSEPMEKSFRDQIVFRLWVFTVVVSLIIIISFFIDKRYVLEKKKKVFKDNFFTRFSLWNYFLFAVIFAAAYLFVVTQFFQGIWNAKLFDAIPDMLVFVVGFMIFVVGLKIRNMRARYFVVYGGLLICIRRLLDIPLQEYQILFGITPVILWIPVIIFEFTGFLLLLIGYRRLRNG